MNMDWQTGDYIIITGYDTDDFYQDQFYRHLINKPTMVWNLGSRGIHLTHPYLDMVPFSDKLKYEKVGGSEDLPYHDELKSMTTNLDTIMGREGLESLKNLRLKNLRLKKTKKRKLKETIIKVLREEEENKVSKIDETLLKVIQRLEGNEMTFEELEKSFGSLENFISILKKRNLLNRINPFDSVYNEIQNSLLYYFVKIDPNYTGVIAEKLLSDITKIGEDYYLDADYSELADLFRTSRNDISEETIEKILSGEYDPYDFGGYDSDDEYRDVYDNLDVYAKSVVNEYIVNELKAMGTFKFPSFGKRLPETFKEIAEEQGNEGEIQLTDEVIKRIMTMEVDCLEYLINRELDDVRSNLNSIYSSCYGDSLVGEWYDTLWGALEGDVVDSRQGEEYQYQKSVWLRDGKRGTKTAYGKRYKVTKCLFELINGWLDSRKDQSGPYSETIEYFGGYVKLMRDSMDYGPMSLIRVPRLDDYPDHRKMEKCMSENVENYF